MYKKTRTLALKLKEHCIFGHDVVLETNNLSLSTSIFCVYIIFILCYIYLKEGHLCMYVKCGVSDLSV